MTERIDPAFGEVIGYWRGIVGTLEQRGLLRQRSRRGQAVLPEAYVAVLLPDRCIFALDMQRLGGISREEWLRRELWKQWQAALQGRRVFISDGGGLAITVAREPGERPRKRLPALIPLAEEEVPQEPYRVRLGYAKRGPVDVNLAGQQRAILIGGTTGSGKTNLMQSIVLQMVCRHTPDEVRVAIVDTKQVDFGQHYGALAHLFAPIAHDVDDAAELIERVENERLRRQAVMAAAGVARWDQLSGEEAVPLLVLLIDEAADFARLAVMKTLIELARKARAFGIAVVLGTQHPTTKVIDAQVKANLPTAIAFQTRSADESRVILGRGGAEQLSLPGRALAFLDGRWCEMQTLRVDEAVVERVVGQASPPPRRVLTEDEEALVRYALTELDGAFTISKLYDQFKGRISKRQLTALGRRWERRGWLTTPASRNEPREVSEELVGLALGAGSGDTVTQVTHGDTALEAVTPGATSGDTPDLPAFLAERASRAAQ